VAEGSSRFSVPECRHAVSIARGSLAEVETQLELSRRLRFMTGADCVQVDEYAARVGQMLTKLYKSLTP
jgi:four helix bundle protein